MGEFVRCAACELRYASRVNGIPYCNKHYQSAIRYGHPNGKQRVSTNTLMVKGGVLVITTKKGETILADTEDREKLTKYSWCISKTGYAVANIMNRVTKMHRYIMGNQLETSDVVDHRNGNRLDNRKVNLRICSGAENAKNLRIKHTNKLGVKGVRITANGQFNVRIVVDGKEIHIGNYSDLDTAIEARASAEKKYHGEFASCLRPEGLEV